MVRRWAIHRRYWSPRQTLIIIYYFAVVIGSLVVLLLIYKQCFGRTYMRNNRGEWTIGSTLGKRRRTHSLDANPYTREHIDCTQQTNGVRILYKVTLRCICNKPHSIFKWMSWILWHSCIFTNVKWVTQMLPWRRSVSFPH